MGAQGSRPTGNLDSIERESWSQKLGLRWVYRAHTSSELLMITHMDRQKEGKEGWTWEASLNFASLLWPPLSPVKPQMPLNSIH